jgi:hypothetical protein
MSYCDCSAAELSKFSPALHSDVCGTVVHMLERRFFRRKAGLGVRQSIPSGSDWQLVCA